MFVLSACGPSASADSAPGAAGAAPSGAGAGGVSGSGSGSASGGGTIQAGSTSVGGTGGSPGAGGAGVSGGTSGASGGAEPDPSKLGPPGSPVALHGQLLARGNRVVDYKGEPTQLKGMSLYWSDVDQGARYFSKDTVKWLVQDWKVSIVRATIGVREQADGYLTNPDDQLKLLDSVMEGALAAGIYVLVDWHDHHANEHVAQAKDFFGKVADKYGSKANVIYEIWNEPRGDGSADWEKDIKPYAETISGVLRQHGAKGLIVVGTPFWDQRPHEVLGKTVKDENVAYSLHFYAGSPAHAFDNTDPSGSIGLHAKAALDGGLPLFVTEFGTTAPDNKNFNEAETRKWLAFLDQKKISYCNWSITAVQEGSAAIQPSASPQGNWSNGDLSQSGALMRSIIRGD